MRRSLSKSSSRPRFVDSFQSGIVGGDGADLRFTESWFDAQDNSLVLCFDYVSEGISLELVSGGVSQSAVTLRYQNGYFTSAQMLFRSFTQTDAGKSELLPDKADELLGLAAGGLPRHHQRGRPHRSLPDSARRYLSRRSGQGRRDAQHPRRTRHHQDQHHQRQPRRRGV